MSLRKVQEEIPLAQEPVEAVERGKILVPDQDNQDQVLAQIQVQTVALKVDLEITRVHQGAVNQMKKR